MVCAYLKKFKNTTHVVMRYSSQFMLSKINEFGRVCSDRRWSPNFITAESPQNRSTRLMLLQYVGDFGHVQCKAFVYRVRGISVAKLYTGIIHKQPLERLFNFKQTTWNSSFLNVNYAKSHENQEQIWVRSAQNWSSAQALKIQNSSKSYANLRLLTIGINLCSWIGT